MFNSKGDVKSTLCHNAFTCIRVKFILRTPVTDLREACRIGNFVFQNLTGQKAVISYVLTPYLKSAQKQVTFAAQITMVSYQVLLQREPTFLSWQSLTFRATYLANPLILFSAHLLYCYLPKYITQ